MIVGKFREKRNWLTFPVLARPRRPVEPAAESGSSGRDVGFSIELVGSTPESRRGTSSRFSSARDPTRNSGWGPSCNMKIRYDRLERWYQRGVNVGDGRAVGTASPSVVRLLSLGSGVGGSHLLQRIKGLVSVAH